MGALCGKESSDDNTPAGRVLGSGGPNSSGRGISAGAGTTSRTFGKQQKPKIGGPARTLGGGSGRDSPAGGSAEDPRAAAARAAELRNAQRSGNGKIASRLEEQKRKTQNQHLVEASRENAAQREERPVWD